MPAGFSQYAIHNLESSVYSARLESHEGLTMSNKSLIPIERIEKAIYLIRGKKVMVDHDLALLYGVETKMLNRAVKRNLKRFPSDFMFQLTAEEADVLKYQIGTSKKGRGGRALPSLRFHRAGRCDALERAEQRTRRIGQRRNHARIYKAATDARVQRGTLPPAGRA